MVALATDAKNTMLFSGDSAGLVKVWGIANFVNVAGVVDFNPIILIQHVDGLRDAGFLSSSFTCFLLGPGPRRRLRPPISAPVSP